jgi:hypothetical protein
MGRFSENLKGKFGCTNSFFVKGEMTCRFTMSKRCMAEEVLAFGMKMPMKG